MEREQQLFSLGQQLEVQVRSMESASKLFSEQRKRYMIFAHILIRFNSFYKTVNMNLPKYI